MCPKLIEYIQIVQTLKLQKNPQTTSVTLFINQRHNIPIRHSSSSSHQLWKTSTHNTLSSSFANTRVIYRILAYSTVEVASETIIQTRKQYLRLKKADSRIQLFCRSKENQTNR